MRPETLRNLLLALIAIALMAIAVRPYVAPARVEAQSAPRNFYFEPGAVMLRFADGSGQAYGKMAIDLRTGKVWGFPTYTTDPYPSNPMDSKGLVVSHPVPLGRFALDEVDK